MITNKDDKNVNIKICDFGFSTSFAGDITFKEFKGSPIYAAPEVLDENYKGNRADIWSSGIVLYALVYGFLPFDEKEMKVLVYKIKKGRI